MKPLHESLPADPLAALGEWLDEAWEQRVVPNANSMVLTTVSMQKGEILPSSRVVLCKHYDRGNGYLVFYTNYHSRKGLELEQQRNAAAVFHWDAMGRQARVEGIVLRSPAEESDKYFASRPRGSQLSAWASEQSDPIASREALVAQLAAVEERFPGEVPRPPHWGGYRLWITALELWTEGEFRLHDRGRWIRTVAIDDDGVAHPDAWNVSRLQP